jgi:hypothetical protein
MAWVRISIRAMCTTLCDKVCQWLATGLSFESGIKHHQTNEEGDFTVPYDAELECKQNVVVYDSNTSTLREEGLFTSFCFVHRMFSFWSVVIMFVWWCLMPLSNEFWSMSTKIVIEYFWP